MTVTYMCPLRSERYGSAFIASENEPALTAQEVISGSCRYYYPVADLGAASVAPPERHFFM